MICHLHQTSTVKCCRPVKVVQNVILTLAVQLVATESSARLRFKQINNYVFGIKELGNYDSFDVV